MAARSVSTINTIPRSGWLVAKNTIAMTSNTTAAAISNMVTGLRRIGAL